MILNVVGAAVLASSALGWLPNAAVPDPVSQWATESGPAAVRTVIAGDPEWLKDVLGEGSDLTLGRPVPVSTLAAEDLPHFDLRSGAMAAIPDSASIVRPATEWASRVQVDGVGRDAVAWIELTAAGVVTLQGVDEVRWLPAVRDLPQDGVVPVNGGVFAFSAGVFTALDAHAAFDAPNGSVSADAMFRALARRNAESAAIARISGPVGGSGLSLLNPDSDQLAAWEAQVDRGLAIPDSQAWRPDGAPQADSSLPSKWIGLGAAILVLASATLILVRRRRSPASGARSGTA